MDSEADSSLSTSNHYVVFVKYYNFYILGD